jgi:peptide-methionine (S)-S-oxide reductase
MRPWILLAALALPLAACRTPQSSRESAAPDSKATTASGPVGNDPGGVGRGTPLKAKPGNELAAFAAGCFWGVEDAFRHVRGVRATAVGYTGGHTEEPTYESVCTHTTGHAEAVLVEFDPKVISYEKLTAIFFKIHDPTQVDQQGPDVGDQYRSEIFTFSDAQAKTAASVREQMQADQKTKFATKIEAVPKFWKAEEYHQQYAEKTGSHGCPISLPPEAT